MAPRLQVSIGEQLLVIIDFLGEDNASFGRILSEARQRGVLAWDRTLRRYLDLLVEGKVLTMKLRDVGSVNLQQIYAATGKKPVVASGLRVLQVYGLNWDVPSNDFYTVTTDLTGLVKSRSVKIGRKQILAASREDALAYELKRNIESDNTFAELVAGVIATQRLDLAYFVKRSDELGVGTLARTLFQRLERLFDKPSDELDGRLFLPARERFLKILRAYSKEKALDLIEKKTPHKEMTNLARMMPTDPQLLQAIGKQLGVNG